MLRDYCFHQISYTSDDDNFLEVVHKELKGFLQRRNIKNLLAFPPCAPRYRFLTHKIVEEFTDLSSISVGNGDDRRTVVFFNGILRKHEQVMTSERRPVKEPWDSHACLVKGRGRGRRQCEDSESSSKGLRRPPQQFYQPGAFSKLSNKENKQEKWLDGKFCESNNKKNIIPSCEVNQYIDENVVTREEKCNNDNCFDKQANYKQNLQDLHTNSIWNTGSEDVTLEDSCYSMSNPVGRDENEECVEITNDSVSKIDKIISTVDTYKTNIVKNKNIPAFECVGVGIESAKGEPDVGTVVNYVNKCVVSEMNAAVKTTMHEISCEGMIPAASSKYEVGSQDYTDESREDTSNGKESDPKLEDITLNEGEDDKSSIPENDDKVECDTVVDNHNTIQSASSSVTNVDSNIEFVNICTVPYDTKKDIKVTIPITGKQETQELSGQCNCDNDHADYALNLIPEKLNTVETVCNRDMPRKATEIEEKNIEDIAPKDDCKQKSKRQTKKEAKAKKKSEKLKKKTKTSKEQVIVAKNVEKSTKHDSKVELEKSEVESENQEDKEELGWEANWNDDGECLTSQDLQQLNKVVDMTDVTVENSKYDYLKFKPKETILDQGVYDHVVELYDFSPELKTPDLIHALSNFKTQGFDIQWVDDTHALAVFSNHRIAETVIKQCSSPLIKMRSLYDGTHESKLKAKRNIDFLKPYKDRPKTSKLVANRLVTGALGVKSKMSKEERELERKKIKEEREKKLYTEKQNKDLWESEELCVNINQ